LTIRSRATRPSPAQAMTGVKDRTMRDAGTGDTGTGEVGADHGSGGAERICVGVIAGPHGIGGTVKVRSFTEEPAAITRYGPLSDRGGRRRFVLRVVGEARGQVLARLDGVADRTQAETLRGVQLYAERAALPAPAEEEEYYHVDLIGLRAERPDGKPLGRIKAVHDFGAGPILEVAPPQGASVMVPFTRAVVPQVDLPAGRLVVDPPPGLLEPVGDETLPGAGPGRAAGGTAGRPVVAPRRG
ncbi:MAG: ribosome maturation factor RimM, partial [Alphaproteobacteria bacterium]